MSVPVCRLYLITPPRPPSLEALTAQVRAAVEAGDVAALQIRMKAATDAEIAQAVAALKPLTEAHDVALILNDRPDLAARLGCDGVHVGQEDAPYAEARRLMGRDRIVGVTCHDSRHQGCADARGTGAADHLAGKHGNALRRHRRRRGGDGAGPGPGGSRLFGRQRRRLRPSRGTRRSRQAVQCGDGGGRRLALKVGGH